MKRFESQCNHILTLAAGMDIPTKCATLLVVVVSLLLPLGASGLDVASYATNSKLASGKWVRVAVDHSGMHCVTESQLRGWGFADPQKVKVYGYGAKRLPDVLDRSYVDDLPQTASEWVSGKGVFFYAEGPVGWEQSATDYFVPVQNPFTDRGYYFLSDSGDEARDRKSVV